MLYCLRSLMYFQMFKIIMLGKIKMKIGLRLWAEDSEFAERFPLSSGGAGTRSVRGCPLVEY